MKSKPLLTLSCLALLIVSAASAQQNELNWTMERAVKQLDRQGSDFETVLSDVSIEWSGDAANALPAGSGRIFANGRGQFRISATAPTARTILLDGNTVHHYDPATQTVEQYSLSKHKDRLEVFLPLGFSTTGKDLSKDFLVTFVGEESIGDRRTLGLELTPKKDAVRAVVSRIQIWVDEASWLPARQNITQAVSGQTLTITYSGTARNLDLNPDLFDDKWPKGTQKKRM